MSLAPAKAKELNVQTGDVVVVIGRRRRGTLGRVEILSSTSKKSSSSSSKNSLCTLSKNLASYLRLRQDDKVKVVPLSQADHDEARSGDLVLLQTKTVDTAASVTFSPIEDSLYSLQASEGGDELSDEEIMERFIQPYTSGTTDGAALIKKGSVLTLVDENGKKLDVMISHVDLQGKPEAKDEEGRLALGERVGRCCLSISQTADRLIILHCSLKMQRRR